MPAVESGVHVKVWQLDLEMKSDDPNVNTAFLGRVRRGQVLKMFQIICLHWAEPGLALARSHAQPPLRAY